MLYVSKKICDQLPDNIIQTLSKLSVERQTLFECLYYRFSKQTLEKKIILYVMIDAVQSCNWVE